MTFTTPQNGAFSSSATTTTLIHAIKFLSEDELSSNSVLITRPRHRHATLIEIAAIQSNLGLRAVLSTTGTVLQGFIDRHRGQSTVAYANQARYRRMTLREAMRLSVQILNDADARVAVERLREANEFNRWYQEYWANDL